MIFRLCLLMAVLSITPAVYGDGRKDVKIKIDRTGFGAQEADIHAVCKSAGDQLLKHMEGLKPLKINVTRGEGSPVSLFKRGENGEIRMRLTASKLYWAQYSYQFSHEICHVLCGYENDYRGNLWFEETLAEMASLYCLRRMSEVWRTDPPYKSWKGFAPHLRSYTDDIIRKRKDYPQLLKTGMRTYYATHARHLRLHPVDREKNGAMAIALLALFERRPDQWNAIRYLNSTPSPKGETFAQYLSKWHNAAPEKHRGFVASIADMYGIELKKTPPPETD